MEPQVIVSDLKDLNTPSGDRDRTASSAEHRPGYGLARALLPRPGHLRARPGTVFRRHWHCVAHESVIANANDFEVFRMADEQVILTRARRRL